MMRALILLTLLSLTVKGELLDRLAITVGQQVITELQLDEDIRVAALLNGVPIVRDLDARRAAADRLVEQVLIHHEMEVSRYPLPAGEEVATYLVQIRQGLGGDAVFGPLLRSYSLSEDTLKEHLALQLTMLRFIEYRFRPDVTVSEADIDTAWQRKLGDWQHAHPNQPAPLPDNAARERLRNAAIAERTDGALNAWLAESRKQVSIVYLDTDLR